MPNISLRIPAECGNLAVYEDIEIHTGKQIKLRIAVIPALSHTPAPDPLFFITGGPGGAATQDYLQLSSAFQQIHKDRDIILVDQRGTGGSNALKCSPIDELTGNNDPDPQAWVETCLQGLDADPKFYTTLDAIQDLDQVREALGYTTINLYGLSYGTRVVQAYMQQYPEHVRAVIMDGIVPQDEPLGIHVAENAQKAMDLIIARCASDKACNSTFPDLDKTFEILLQQVEKTPTTVEIPHPTTGEPTEVYFTRDMLAGTLRLFSYSPETVALLPLLIHTTQRTGDFSNMAAQALIISQQLQGNLSEGVSYSVSCAEDVPFFYQDGVFVGNREAEQTSYLQGFSEKLEQICAYWPAEKVPEDFKAPIISDIPTLLLSGEIDPVTPPTNADHVAKTLSHSLHLVAPEQGHGVITRGCIAKIATEFIEQGNVDNLKTDCVADIKAQPFFINFSGPEP